MALSRRVGARCDRAIERPEDIIMKKRRKLTIPRETIRSLTSLSEVHGGVECSTSGYTKYDCDPPVVTP